jgi:hypothetical protein
MRYYFHCISTKADARWFSPKTQQTIRLRTVAAVPVAGSRDGNELGSGGLVGNRA